MLDIYAGKISLTFDSLRISSAEWAESYSLSESAHGEGLSFFVTIPSKSDSDFENLIFLATERIRKRGKRGKMILHRHTLDCFGNITLSSSLSLLPHRSIISLWESAFRFPSDRVEGEAIGLVGKLLLFGSPVFELLAGELMLLDDDLVW